AVGGWCAFSKWQTKPVVCVKRDCTSRPNGRFALVLCGSEGRSTCLTTVLSFVPFLQLLRWAHKGSICAPRSAGIDGCEISSRVGRSDATAGWSSRNEHRPIPIVRRLGFVVLRGFLYHGRISFPQSAEASNDVTESTGIQCPAAG